MATFPDLRCSRRELLLSGAAAAAAGGLPAAQAQPARDETPVRAKVTLKVNGEERTLELDTRDVLIHEKRYIGSIGGSCSPDRDFPTLVQWHRDGRLDLGALVTERFTLDQINEATTALDEGRISGRAILEL